MGTSKIKGKENTITYCQGKAKIKKSIIRMLERKIQRKDEEMIKSNYDNTHIRERD